MRNDSWIHGLYRQQSKIYPEDREKIKQIYKEAKEATVEIREFGEDGDIKIRYSSLRRS